MRQIELVAQALGQILKQALKGGPREALALFDQAYQPLLGVSARVAATLDERQLLTLLTGGARPDARRVAAAVEVLKVEGDLLEQAGQPGHAARRWRRALGLAAFLAGQGGLPDRDLAGALLDRASKLDLDPGEQLAACRVLEALGRFADAEDVLFEAIEADPDDDRPVDEGIAFYRRLLEHDDAALEAGNLPRDEVESSLAELLRRQARGPADHPS